MTTVTPKFQIDQIKCNGTSMSLVSKENTNAIQTYVSTYRQLEDFSSIVENLEDDGWAHYYGPRCSSDEQVTNRITSALTEHALKVFQGDKELAEMWINAQVEMFTGRMMTYLVTESLRDCSSADHWYTFEKEWE